MSLPGLRLLLVEDNPGDVRLFQEMLAVIGHPPAPRGLMVAGDLAQARSLLQVGHFDAMLLDLGLPDSQGLSTLNTVLAQGHDMPVIVLTGLNDHEIGDQALQIGAQDYLVKDEMDPGMVVRAVRYAIGRHQALMSARQESARAAAAEARLHATEEGRTVLEQEVGERRSAQARLERSLDRLQALRRIDRAIIHHMDRSLPPMLRVVLDQAMAQLNVDAGAISLLEQPGLLVTADRRGPAILFNGQEPLPTTDPAISAALADGSVTIVLDDADHPAADGSGQPKAAFAREPAMRAANLKSYHLNLLGTAETPVGVLEVFSREQLPPNDDWLDFAETLAGQATMAIDSTDLHRRLQAANLDLIAAYDAAIAGWSGALDLRDKETEGHSRRVTDLSLRLATRLGLQGDDLAHLRRGALLHDIGKMGVPDAILQKPGPLDDEEWVVMRRHTDLAKDLLTPMPYLHPAIDVPYCHHERWDGAGYPRGLAGTDIPLAARIFAVVDVYDALTNDRPYRAAWPVQKAVDHIKEQAGKHFDPAIVEAFLELLATGDTA